MRIAFKMKIRPDQSAEYEARHNPIWPELESTLMDHGAKSYTIFLDRETGTLFAYAEIEDLERWKAVAQTEVCRRWWESMAPLMEVNPDKSPKATSLDEVFHIGSES